MGKIGPVDRELSALIRDVIAAELLAPNSLELKVAELVASSGLGALDAEGRGIWEARLLPILSKPLSEQIAIASIIRRGGYVPRRIEIESRMAAGRLNPRPERPDGEDVSRS